MLYFDYKQCEKIIRHNSKSFYKAFSKLSNRNKRNGIYAVYAFCRVADDLVDNHNDLKGLNELEDHFRLFLRKKITSNYLWNALGDVFERYEMSEQAFFDLLEGQRMDEEIKEYETIDQLKTYCYHVASTVGLMITPILAPKTHTKLESCAINLGYAMQITNILRDIGEDYKRGRVYLPSKLMKKYKYTKDDLDHKRINDQFIKLWEHLAKIAEDYYEQGLSEIDYFPTDSKLSVTASVLFYKEILNECRRNNYDVFTKKNFVSDEDKVSLLKAYFNKH